MECAQKLVATIDSKAAADNNLADHLIPWIALTKGGKIKPALITNHLKTNVFEFQFFQSKYTLFNFSANN